MIDVTVYGAPVGQGAIKHLGKGRPAIHANGKLLHPWRNAIVAATARRLDELGIEEPLDGPLRLEAVFSLPRPKTVTREYPTVPPDIDHLERALCDALKKARAITDDARIVKTEMSKQYETTDVPPGVSFQIARLRP